MPVNLEAEVIRTDYDPIAREGIYTVERAGRRWTVRIPLDDLNRYGDSPEGKRGRRNHLTNILDGAMNTPDDDTRAKEASQQAAAVEAAKPKLEHAGEGEDHPIWRPEWCHYAQEVATSKGWALARNRHGVLLFIHADGRFVPISFLHIDNSDESAEASLVIAQHRVDEAAKGIVDVSA